MYGSPRFLDQNLVTASMITASMQAAGIVGGTEKTGTGTSNMYAVGGYTGTSDLTYTVQCDGAGTVDTDATFRWRTSDTAAGAWEASAVSATSTLTTLSNAVQIAFTAGTLVENDTWFFDARATYGPGNLLNFDRNQVWRSSAWSTLLTNGGFDSDTSSWTGVDCTLASVAGGQSGNCLQITRTGGSVQYAHQAYATTAGKEYIFRAYVKTGTSGDEAGQLEVWDLIGAGSIDTQTFTSSSAWTQYEIQFVAISASTRCSVQKSTATAGTMLFDTCELLEIPTLTVDLGSAQAFTAFLTGDHNFSANATITFKANSSDSWASPAYSSTFSTLPDLLNLYTSQTYQYVRLSMCDPDNSDGYVQLSHFYLGTYRALSEVHAEWGSALSYDYIGMENRSTVGVLRQFVYGEQKAVELNWPKLTNADVAILRAFQQNLVNIPTGQVVAFFFHLFNDEEDYVYIMHWLNFKSLTQQFFAYLINGEIPMQLLEVFKGRT